MEPKHVRDCVEGIIHVACKSYDVATVRRSVRRSMATVSLPRVREYFKEQHSRNPTLEHRYGACILDGGKQFSRSVPLSIGEDEKKTYKLPPAVCPLTRDETTAVERGLVKKLGIKSRLEAVLATSRGIPLNINRGKKKKKRVAEGKLKSKVKKKRRRDDK